MRSLRGVTLVELIVAMVAVAVVGTALTQLMIVQSGFMNDQDAVREARATSRAAWNVLLSDLRMVETSGGVVAAAPTDVTIRVPYALGVFCANSGGRAQVSLFPSDSITYANAQFAGYAWRDSSDAYTYEEASASVGTGIASVCTTESIATVTGGEFVSLRPAAPAGAETGTPILLFQRIRFEFKDSSVMPGRIGLWRTVAGGTGEELVAPFDSSSGFGFFVPGVDTAMASPPSDLSDVMGLQLKLHGESSVPTRRSTDPSVFELDGAVFFKNRSP